MKALLTLTIALASHATFALSSQDSWETILNTKNIQTQATTVAFSAGDATSFVSILEVCALNANQFATVEPQNIWKVERVSNTTQHQVIGFERLVGSNKATSMVKSVGTSSPVYTPVIKEISRVQNVDVMYKIVGSSSSATKLFTKSFTVPDCQQ